MRAHCTLTVSSVEDKGSYIARECRVNQMTNIWCFYIMVTHALLFHRWCNVECRPACQSPDHQQTHMQLPLPEDLKPRPNPHLFRHAVRRSSRRRQGCMPGILTLLIVHLKCHAHKSLPAEPLHCCFLRCQSKA